MVWQNFFHSSEVTNFMLPIPEASKTPLKTKWEVLVILIAVTGVFWRMYWIFLEHPAKNYIFSDMQVYYETALRLLDPHYTGRIDDTIHPPATSFLMAFTYRFDPTWLAFNIVQFVTSAAVPFLIAAIGYDLFGVSVALIALVISSLYFPFIDYASYFLAENPFLFLLLLSTWLLIRSLRSSKLAVNIVLALLSGLSLGCALGFKGQAWIPGFLIAVFLAIAGWKHRWRRIGWVHAGVGVGLLTIVVPLTVRSTRINDNRFALIAANGPMNILFGHYGEPGHMIFHDSKRNIHLEYLGPSAYEHGSASVNNFPFGPYDSEECLAYAWKWIRENKFQALCRSFDQVYDQFFVWEAWPTNGTRYRRWTIEYQQLFLVFILFPAAMHVVLNFRKMLRLEPDVLGDLLILLPVLGICIGAFITVGEVRYRIPFDGFLILLAARAYAARPSASLATGN
jgi:4-amino-4-deoxy-L-arabinose transferase-like glycosyltransferase